MPSGEHEAPAALTRRVPGLLDEVVHAILGVGPPDAAYIEAKPTEIRVMRTFHADGVEVRFDGVGRPMSAQVFEVQRRFDATKTGTWPLYVTEVQNEWHVPTRLLVFCPDRGVANKYRAIYEAPVWPTGALQPLIFTAVDVPVITDLNVAAAEPLTTLFYTMCRARMRDVAETFPAVVRALLTTGEKHGWDLAQEYDEMVSAALLQGPAGDLWEAFMSTAISGREYRNRLWEEALAQGEARGVVLGEARGEARGVVLGEARGLALGEALGEAHGAAVVGAAILALLGARQVPVSEAVRVQILACTDLPTITTWLDRAETATTADEVVRP
jgi:hypothetical protein